MIGMPPATADDCESLTLDTLKQKGVASTTAVLSFLKDSDVFLRWSSFLSNAIRQRDDEDGFKLHRGIMIAIHRGTLLELTEEERALAAVAYESVDVLGKTPVEVSDFIWEQVKRKKEALLATNSSDENDAGELIALCGLSGTGKGTTFATLGEKLRQEKGSDYVVNWSNGNIFRCIALLSILWCENEFPGDAYDNHKALTKENISAYMQALTFEKVDGRYETRIEGLGLNTVISKIENTLLQQSNVAKILPTVAEQTQGEVILFANAAIAKLRRDGMTILLEGREQTLDYIKTPYKFRLILSDSALIGKRRAAQLLVASVLQRIEDIEITQDPIDLHEILIEELQYMANKDMTSN